MSNSSKDGNGKEDQPIKVDPALKFIFEAVRSELNKIMPEFEEMYGRIGEVKRAAAAGHKAQPRRRDADRGGRGRGRGRNPRPHREMEFDDYVEDSEFDEMEDRKSYRGGERTREDNNLGNIKINISSFHGKNDPETYLEWERKVELMFDCHNYSELKKVKLAAIEFSDYA